MIRKEMPDNIKEFKPKLFAGLTLRESLFIVLAGILAFIVYKATGGEITSSVIVAIIPIAFAKIEPYEMPLEKFLYLIFVSYILPPKIRKYKINNEYDDIINSKKDANKEKDDILRSRKKKQKNQKSKNIDIMSFK